MEYKFKGNRDEETSIEWRKNSRIKLNKIIKAYNNWQIEDNFDKSPYIFDNTGKTKLINYEEVKVFNDKGITVYPLYSNESDTWGSKSWIETHKCFKCKCEYSFHNGD